MKTSVDALVLIGHANKIVHEVPGFVAASISGQLETLRSGSHSELHDTITETDMNNLLAGEAFLALGRLATSQFVGVPVQRRYPNPFRDTAMSIIDEVSPFQKGTVLDPAVSRFLALSGEVTDDDTRDMFAAAVGDEPGGIELFRQKWLRSVEIFRSHGDVAIKAYRKDELIGAISDLNLKDLSPDTFEFDVDGQTLTETRTVDGLIEHANIPLHEVVVSYFSTFRQANATEMFADAVIGLKDLGTVIRDI